MFHIKSIDVLNLDLFVETMKIGKVKGVVIDPEQWKLTHLEVELNKEAANEILGANKVIRNKLVITALQNGKPVVQTKE